MMFRTLVVALLLAVAPLPGVAQEDDRKIPEAAAKAIVARIQQSMRYPLDAKDAFGTVIVTFRLDDEGRLARSSVLTGSCSEALDREVLAALARASPFPADIPRNQSYTLPVVFLKTKASAREVDPRLDCVTPQQKDRERDRALGLHPPE